jgi:predicted Zn-dependent protease
MIAQVLELAMREAQQAEVYAAVSNGTMVHFEANRLKQVESRQSRSVGAAGVPGGASVPGGLRL